MLLVGFCRLTTMASPSQAARVSFAGMESGERVSLEAFAEGNTTASTSSNTPTTFFTVLLQKRKTDIRKKGKCRTRGGIKAFYPSEPMSGASAFCMDQ